MARLSFLRYLFALCVSLCCSLVLLGLGKLDPAPFPPEIHAGMNPGRPLTASATTALRSPPDGIERYALGTREPGGISRHRKSPWILEGVVESRGRGVEGAEVWLELRRSGVVARPARCLSGDGGVFLLDISALEDLPPWELRAARPSILARSRTEGVGSLWFWTYDREELASEEPWRIPLEPGGFLSGKVVDRWGSPVAGAEVGVDEWYIDTLTIHTLTDEEGRYRIGINELGQLEGEPITVTARREGVGAGSVNGLVVPGADAWIQDLMLGGESVMAGRLVFPGGAPLANVQIWLVRMEEENGPEEDGVSSPGLTETTARTDFQGAFRAIGLKPGTFRVLVADYVAEGMELVRSTEEPPGEMVVSGARVHVRVLDAEGGLTEHWGVQWTAWESGMGNRVTAAWRGEAAGDLFEHRMRVPLYGYYGEEPGPVFSMVVPRETWWYGRATMPDHVPLEQVFFVGQDTDEISVELRGRALEWKERS